MKCVVVIPARLSSTRISEKPLADLAEKPLIQRVFENASQMKNSDEIVIAADSQKVFDVVEGFGGKCILTPPELASGSDRVHYIVEKYYAEADIVVNLQGDEPFIDTDIVDLLIDTIAKEDCGVMSAYFPVNPDIAEDSSVVKVVMDKAGMALYFSRSKIPNGAQIYNKHIGVYVWKRENLKRFHAEGPSELEKTERLEQLRVLEYGEKIKLLESSADSLGIDTMEDLEKARRIING
ncbi:3-deoxy-manno-octulosonate cytidylyltransferase [Elusimicrobiota bacterium]